MPVQILTVRVRDADGRVVAKRRAPFVVRHDDEDEDKLMHELRRLMRDLEHLIDDVIASEDE